MIKFVWLLIFLCSSAYSMVKMVSKEDREELERRGLVSKYERTISEEDRKTLERLGLIKRQEQAAKGSPWSILEFIARSWSSKIEEVNDEDEQKGFEPKTSLPNRLFDWLWSEKKGNWKEAIASINSLDVPLNSCLDEINLNFDMVNIARLKDAMAHPIQLFDEKNGDQSGGLNIGYRAFCYLNEPKNCNFESFIKDWPQKKRQVGIWRAKREVRPTPKELASHLDLKMREAWVEYRGYKFFGQYEQNEFFNNIQKGLPIIVSLVSDKAQVHYAMIIGAAPVLLAYKWVILEADGQVGVISSADLEYWMDASQYDKSERAPNFNAILFRPVRDSRLFHNVHLGSSGDSE